MTAPTARSRLSTLGTLLLYLASIPALGLLWASVAYRRFPQIGFRDQLYQVGSISTTILGGMLAVAVVVVLVTIVAMAVWPNAARVPLVGLALNVILWAASVATMVEPPAAVGG